MGKIIPFPDVPDPDRFSWEEALESGVGIHAPPGMPPPPGVCPIAWAVATQLFPDPPEEAEITPLPTRRV